MGEQDFAKKETALAAALHQLIRQCDIDEGEDLAWLLELHPNWREECLGPDWEVE
jgi:hypothetical protein